jgi:hypothetical protein
MPQGMMFTFGRSPGNEQADFRRIDPRVLARVVLALPSTLPLKVINEILASATSIHTDSN